MDLMKRTLLFVLLFLSFCFADTIDVSKRITQDFLLDFASVNNYVYAELYLDVYKEDLSSMDFSEYIRHVKNYKPASAKNLDEVISQADQHLFQAEKNYFILILYYKKEKYLILDDSSTNFIDFADFSADSDLNQLLKKYMNSRK